MNKRIIDLFTLENKLGILTGGSSGIGYATACMLADAGATVYVLSRSGKVKVKVENENKNLIHIACNINNYDEATAKVNEIGKKHGRIDFVVNNAGITIKKKSVELSMIEWETVHKTNVDALFNISKSAFEYLKKADGRGRIVNIGSMASYLGFDEVVPYCSSKAAVLGITRGLAVEWANENINVNAVLPGWIPSEMNKQVMDEERKRKILSRMPVHEFGEQEDIGAMVLYLCSRASKYITGQDFAVDGGALAYGY